MHSGRRCHLSMEPTTWAWSCVCTFPITFRAIWKKEWSSVETPRFVFPHSHAPCALCEMFYVDAWFRRFLATVSFQISLCYVNESPRWHHYHHMLLAVGQWWSGLRTCSSVFCRLLCSDQIKREIRRFLMQADVSGCSVRIVSESEIICRIATLSCMRGNVIEKRTGFMAVWSRWKRIYLWKFQDVVW